MFIAQRNNSRNRCDLTNSSQPTNRAILDEQPLFWAISRGHCSPKETREATEAPSSQVISLNKLSSKSDNLMRPPQPKRSSRPLQPKHSLTPTASIKWMKTDNLEATDATFYQGEKLYRWIKQRHIWVGNNWQNKNDSIHFYVDKQLHPSA